MTIMRAVQIEQPDYQWQYQLRHERDVTAQLEAIEALQHHPTPATRLALTDTIENEHCYYKVRLRAAHCLTKVTHTQSLLNTIYLIQFYKYITFTGRKRNGGKLVGSTSNVSHI